MEDIEFVIEEKKRVHCNVLYTGGWVTKSFPAALSCWAMVRTIEIMFDEGNLQFWKTGRYEKK